MNLVNTLGVRWNAYQGVEFQTSTAQLFFSPWNEPDPIFTAQLEENQATLNVEPASIKVDCFVIVPQKPRPVQEEEEEQAFTEILHLPGPVLSDCAFSFDHTCSYITKSLRSTIPGVSA